MFRTMERAKKHFRYQLYLGKTMNVDQDGLFTGEYTPKYSEIIDAWANINGASGRVNRQNFGEELDYTKVILTVDDIPIDEHTRLWIDDLDADEPDYVVKRVIRSQMDILRVQIAKVMT